MFVIIYKILNRVRVLYFNLRYRTYFSKYNIDTSFKFNGVDIEMYGDGDIIIGPNSYIGNRSVLATCQGSKIIIGKCCAISHNVRIYTINRDANSIINGDINPVYDRGDVVIGDNVWIGANVFINQGTYIGSNVVIGANSVVTKNIPSNTIVAGAPAKIIRGKG
ncbi:MAG: acyltransferase [Spirosomataceae bacterium]